MPMGIVLREHGGVEKTALRIHRGGGTRCGRGAAAAHSDRRQLP